MQGIFKKLALWGLAGLPIIAFYLYVNHYAINVGWNDDFHGIEGFLASWMQQETFVEKFQLLFSQMCEHRILYVRLSTLLCYHLFGEVNYKIMMLMGVSYLLILPFVFYRVLKEINLSLAYTIPIIFIIFNVQPIENIFWAITSLQPNVVIIFGLLSFCLLLFTKKKAFFYLSAVLCWIAMFTNGNGMFSFLASIPIVLYARTRSEKIEWFGFIAFCFIWYFYDFKKPGIRPDVMINFIEYPHIIVADFFAFFGSPIDSTIQFYNEPLKFATAIFSGAAMLFWCGSLTLTFLYFYFFPTHSKLKKGFFAKIKNRLIEKPRFNLFLLASFIFVALSGAAFSVARASQGLNDAFLSRYKTVSIILFIITYLSVFNFIKPQNLKKYLGFSLVFTIFFNLLSYYASTDDVLIRRRFLATNMINYINNGRYYFYRDNQKSRNPDDHAPISSYQKLPIPPYNYAGYVEGVMKYVNDILFISRKHFHNYTPPTELAELNQRLFDAKVSKNTNEIEVLEFPIEFKIKIKNAYIPFNDVYGGYYATFTNEKNKLCFPLETQANKFSTFVSTQIYFNNHIVSGVVKPDLPTGNFLMKIGHFQNNQFTVLYEKEVEIK